jgi:hypothetical protein
VWAGLDPSATITLVIYPDFVKEEIYPVYEPEGSEMMLVAEIEAWAVDEDEAQTVAIMHFCMILNSMDIQHPKYEAFDVPWGFG